MTEEHLVLWYRNGIQQWLKRIFEIIFQINPHEAANKTHLICCILSWARLNVSTHFVLSTQRLLSKLFL